MERRGKPPAASRGIKEEVLAGSSLSGEVHIPKPTSRPHPSDLEFLFCCANRAVSHNWKTRSLKKRDSVSGRAPITHTYHRLTIKRRREHDTPRASQEHTKAPKRWLQKPCPPFTSPPPASPPRADGACCASGWLPLRDPRAAGVAPRDAVPEQEDDLQHRGALATRATRSQNSSAYSRVSSVPGEAGDAS